jgi:hypothetical protein
MLFKKVILSLVVFFALLFAGVSLSNATPNVTPQSSPESTVNPYEVVVIINGEVWIIIYNDGGEIIGSYKPSND